MSDIEDELKTLIVQTLMLKDVQPQQIDVDVPLFAAGLGLDSIDALELAVAIERRYCVTIPDEAVGKKVFQSVSALADYVAQNQAA